MVCEHVSYSMTQHLRPFNNPASIQLLLLAYSANDRHRGRFVQDRIHMLHCTGPVVAEALSCCCGVALLLERERQRDTT